MNTTLAHAFRRRAFPLAAYYAVTLGIPLVNGAAQSGSAFVKHALMVLVIPPLVIILPCAVRAAAHALLQVPLVDDARSKKGRIY